MTLTLGSIDAPLDKGRFIGRRAALRSFRDALDRIRALPADDALEPADVLFPHIFLVTGAAGWGKSALLRQFELVCRAEQESAPIFVTIDWEPQIAPGDTVALLRVLHDALFRAGCDDDLQAFRDALERRVEVGRQVGDAQQEYATLISARPSNVSEALRTGQLDLQTFEAAVYGLADGLAGVEDPFVEFLRRRLAPDEIELYANPGALGAEFVAGLNQAAHRDRPVVLLLEFSDADTYYLEWLRRWLLPHSGPHVLWVLAAAVSPEQIQHFRDDFPEELLARASLDKFSRLEVSNYLRQHGPRPGAAPNAAFVAAVQQATGSAPLAVELLANMHRAGVDVKNVFDDLRGQQHAPLAEAMGTLVGRFLEYCIEENGKVQIDPDTKRRHRRWIYGLTLLRYYDSAALGDIQAATEGNGAPDPESMRKELREHYSFLFGAAKSKIHPLVKRILRRQLLAAPPSEMLTAFARAAAEYYRQQRDEHAANLDVRRRHEVLAWQQATLNYLNALFWADRSGKEALRAFIPAYLEATEFNRALADEMLQLALSFSGLDSDVAEQLQAIADNAWCIRPVAVLPILNDAKLSGLSPQAAWSAFDELLAELAAARLDMSPTIRATLAQLSQHAEQWALTPLQRGLLDLFRGRHLASVGQLEDTVQAYLDGEGYTQAAPVLRSLLAAALSQLGWQSGLARGITAPSEVAGLAFSHAKELEPLNGFHWIGAGVALYSSLELEAALESTRRGIELDGERSYALNWLGSVNFARGRLGKATAAYERAIELHPQSPDAHYGLGNVLLRMGHHEKSRAAYARAVELHNTFPQPHNGLGDVYAALGRRDEAIEAYQRAIDLDPRYAMPHNGLGNVYVELGRHEEAQPMYERAIELGGLNETELALVHNGLGTVHFHLGRHAEAVAAHKYAIELDPQLAPPHVGLGDVYLHLGRHAEAIIACQRAIELDAEYAAAHNTLGNVYRAQGEHEKATAAYQRAIELDAEYAAPYAGLGGLYAELDRYREAVTAYQRSIDLHGQNEHELALAYKGLGSVYHNQGSHAEAIDAYQRALDLGALDDHGTAIVNNGLGDLYRALGRYDEAIAAYQQAIDIGVLGGHELAVVHSGLGTVYRIQNRNEDAVVSYRLAMVLDPKYAYPHNGLGNIHYMQGEYEAATAAYERAIELDPNYAYPHNGLGNVYADLGHHGEAVAAYQRAIDIGGVDDHERAIFYNGLGNGYADQGESDEAVAAYQRAVELDPTYAYPYSGLGGVYADLGSHDDALEAYQRAIELRGLGDKELAVVYNGIGNVYRALRRYEEATAAYQQAIVLHPKNPAPHTGLGGVCAAMGDYDAAFAAYQRAIELGGLGDYDLAVVHNGLGKVYAAMGRYGQAAAAFTRAIEQDVLGERDLANVHSDLGDVRIAIGQYAEAAADFERAIELDAQNAAAHSGLGTVRRLLGQHAEAITAFQWAIELNPEDAYAPNGLGDLHLAHKDYAEAEAAYRRAIELDANYAAPHGGLGAVFHAQERYDQALAEYARAIELDSDDPLHRSGQGHALLAMGLYDEALTAYQRAIGMGSLAGRELAIAHNGLGDVHHILERRDEAIEAYQQAIVLHPSYATPHGGLGVVYMELGRDDDALAAFQRALKLGGLEPHELARMHYHLGKVYTLLDNPHEALAAYQHASEADPQLARTHISLAASYRRQGSEATFDEQIEKARALVANATDYDRACLEGLCGRVDTALDLLDSALEKKQATVAWARRDPELEPVRDSPRFEAIVQEYTF